MADIFISYAKTDRMHAERLAAALEDQGWSVWWDPEIPAGKTFDDVIEQAIEAARSILVIWSKHSVNSRWVRTEAAEGADRGILVPVQIEDTRIPLAFKRIQAANLIGWDGTKSHLAFKKLVSDIASILGPSPTAVAEEQAAKREADLDAKRKADEEKAKQAEEEARRKTEAEKRRLAEQEAQLKAEEAQKSEEDDAKRKAKEAPASRIAEPDNRTVPPASLRSPLTKIAVLGGIIVVAILTAVIISREHESVRESYVPDAYPPVKNAKLSKPTTALSPEMVEIPHVEGSPDELSATRESSGTVEAPAQPSIETAPGDLPGELSRSQWTEVQRALSDIGYDVGVHDGIPGPKTRTAITLFQGSRGFPTSGQLTEDQRTRLFSHAREAAQGRLGVDPAQADGPAVLPEMVEPPEPVTPKPPFVASAPETAVAPNTAIAPKRRETWTEPVTGMQFVWIPKGCVDMGSPKNEEGRDDDERQHRVCLEGYWLGKYEVTNVQYRHFRSDHNSGNYKWRSLNGDHQPVVKVDWYAATDFAAWLSQKTEEHFRLPTEAEWEYAARAGTETARYWDIWPRYYGDCKFSNFYDATAISWFDIENLDSYDARCPDDHVVSATAGEFESNGFDLYHILGNASEWTCSVYDEAYDGAEKECANKGSNGRRVIRGGSWHDTPQYVRSASRKWLTPDSRDNSVGFRLARTP